MQKSIDLHGGTRSINHYYYNYAAAFTTIVFFLSLENHILEDVNKCVIALQEGDVDTLDRTAGAIRGRAARVVHIINAEMENYEPGVYTERVLESIKLLSETGECTVLYTKRVWH